MTVSNEREPGLQAENARLRAELSALRAQSEFEDARVADVHAGLASAQTWNAQLQKANDKLTKSEVRNDLLLAELNHRVKNILATVQGLASQTLKGTGGDPARFARHFGARLRTLARAHDMLTARGWAPTPVEDTVQNALAPWLEAGRVGQIEFRTMCPGAPVSPRQAQALVLALHELATNATKYGALSTRRGRVDIRCEVSSGGKVVIHWVESDGPPVTKPPDRRGFGTRMLERGLALDLGPGSSVDLRFEPAGLQVEIHFTSR